MIATIIVIELIDLASHQLLRYHNYMILKDFTYIDFERVRSYLAQMNGKLSEQIVEAKEHATGIEAGAKSGALTKFLVDAEAKGNYMYTKSSSETSSLHHAIFDSFEEQAQDNEWVGTLEDDKPFTKIACNIKVVDYKLLAEQFKSTATMMPLLDRIANQVTGAPKPSNRHADNHQTKQIMDIAKAVELLFGEVRVMQLINEQGGIIAQAFLDEELLPQKSVFFAHNNEVLPEEWTVFCLKPLKQRQVLSPQYIGEDFADKLQAASDALKDLKQVIMPDKATPTIVPIAIYRSLS